MPILIASGKRRPVVLNTAAQVIRGRNTANELVVELFEPVPAVRRTALRADLLE